MAFHFRQRQSYFRLPLTLSRFAFWMFLIPGIFHPRRWPPVCAHWPGSKAFPLDSNPLDLARISKVHLSRSALFSLLLKYFEFRGVNEYLEDLTSRFNAPLLGDFRITFFNRLIFNTPRLCSFISRAERLRSHSRARMTFYHDAVELSHITASRPGLELTILCNATDWQLYSLTQICDPRFLSLFNLEHLEICEAPYSQPHWQEDVENTQWLDLLRLFTTVKSLSISEEFTPRVVPALQELAGERIMDVLPTLQSISLPESSLSAPVKEAFEQFLVAQQLSGHPVAVNPQGNE
jgi:hypothetical protein